MRTMPTKKAELQKTFVKNRIDEILKERGFENFSPTNALLELLELSRIGFFKIVDNKHEPRLGEAIRLAEWLKISLTELYEII